MAGYIPGRYTRPKTVTHPGTNRARRALTSFMRRTPLTTTPRRQPVVSGWKGNRRSGVAALAVRHGLQWFMSSGAQDLHSYKVTARSTFYLLAVTDAGCCSSGYHRSVDEPCRRATVSAGGRADGGRRRPGRLFHCAADGRSHVPSQMC